MSSRLVDARGRSCPEPVLMARNAANTHPEGFAIVVDNSTAMENISRFGRSSGFRVEVQKTGEEYTIKLSR